MVIRFFFSDRYGPAIVNGAEEYGEGALRSPLLLSTKTPFNWAVEDSRGGNLYVLKTIIIYLMLRKCKKPDTLEFFIQFLNKFIVLQNTQTYAGEHMIHT